MSALPQIGAGGRRPMIVAVTVCAIGQAAGAGLAAFSTRDIFVALGSGGGLSTLTSRAADLPAPALGALIASGCIIAALRVTEGIFAERLGQSYAGDVRMKLFDHISRLPGDAVRTQRRGGLSLRFVGDLSALRGWISKGLTRLISATIVLPATIWIIFALDWRLGSAVVGPIAGGLTLMFIVSRVAEPLHARVRQRRARLSADMSERAPLAPELRALGRMRREKKRLANRTAALAGAAVARARISSLMRAIPDAVSGLACAMVLLVALQFDITAATAAGALAATALTIRPLRELATVWDRRRDWQVARDKCMQLLARKPVTRRRRRGKGSGKGHPTSAALKFDNVRHGALQRCSAEISAGDKVAILGRNSTGKSTLLALASGIDVPDRGRVTLSGRPVASLSNRSRRIALICDGAAVLAGSLRRALTLGVLPRPDDETIRSATDEAGLRPLVHRLGGLDGQVAEGGRNLSSGEVWRVLMVRAKLAGQDVLLIDSPDRALDEEGISLLVRTVHNTSATVIVTTDDPVLADRFDKVFSLRNGRLAPLAK